MDGLRKQPFEMNFLELREGLRLYQRLATNETAQWADKLAMKVLFRRKAENN
jgi:hypothetical protein